MTTLLFCDACGAVLSALNAPCPACGQLPQSATAQPLARADELVPGFLLTQRYRIAKKIGEGGFGLVYKAWDTREGRHVAIKQITLAALNAREMIEATDSYNREITILPRLYHRHVPELYDYFTDPEHWYIVMQYIDGETLEERLEQTVGGRLTVNETIYIGAQLCEVLGYLHEQEPPVIFRDVKPANVMISRKTGDIYLIDFGIARRYRPEQNKDTRLLGSPGYAAPEQYGKAQSTTRTDMYGLGATLQTLLTGKEPHEIQATGIPADCTIPSELQALITRMMERDPDQRPASMWAAGQSLSKLQKLYPFSPLSMVRKTTRKAAPPSPSAWLEVLWSLCMLFVLTLASFFASSREINWSWFFTELLAFLLAFCSVAGVIVYLLFKKSRASSNKLTRKEVQTVIRESLAKSSNWMGMMTYAAFSMSAGGLLDSFSIQNLVIFATYVAIYIIGMLVINRQYQLFLKRVQQTQPAPQGQSGQQAVQQTLIQQRMKK